MGSPIDFSPIPDPNHKNSNELIFDISDDSVIANPILPVLTPDWAPERFTDAAGIFEVGEAFIEKLQDALRNLAVQIVEFARSFAVEFDRPDAFAHRPASIRTLHPVPFQRILEWYCR